MPKYGTVSQVILLHEKFLQFDWLRAVAFQLNLKYLHVKITNFLRVVVKPRQVRSQIFVIGDDLGKELRERIPIQVICDVIAGAWGKKF